MIEVIKGSKHEKDKIVLINGHQITYKELACICVMFAKNEDNVYPPPAKGGEYFIEFLNECLKERKVSKDILQKFKLSP